MENMSRFFIKRFNATILKMNVEVVIVHPVTEKEANAAAELISKQNPFLERELKTVSEKCNTSDRAVIHELGKIGWVLDDGIMGFSKELEIPEKSLKVVLGISCEDKQIFATMYRQ
ncbi:MAG: hypothetical protein QW039_06490 [Fervidicoccaceae archaeon]